jgi:glutaredoxin-like YruB-family protein
MATITIYSTPTCPYCKQTKQFLDDNNIAYTDIDVSSDATKAQEMIEKSGQMGVPVIDIDGDIIVGFDQARLSEKLGIN